MFALTAMVVLLASAEPAAEPAWMTRSAIRAERLHLLDERAKVVLPTMGLVLGGGAAIVLPVAFLVLGSSYVGIATYLAVILISGGSLGLVVGALSAVWLVMTAPKRQANADRLEALTNDLLAGRCRTEPGELPCRDRDSEQTRPKPMPAAPFVPLFVAPL
jgi:hypothetical protein